jgi:hypothetical protein
LHFPLLRRDDFFDPTLTRKHALKYELNPVRFQGDRKGSLKTFPKRFFILGNALGMLDLITAVTLSVLCSASSLGILEERRLQPRPPPPLDAVRY